MNKKKKLKLFFIISYRLIDYLPWINGTLNQYILFFFIIFITKGDKVKLLRISRF